MRRHRRSCSIPKRRITDCRFRGTWGRSKSFPNRLVDGSTFIHLYNIVLIPIKVYHKRVCLVRRNYYVVVVVVGLRAKLCCFSLITWWQIERTGEGVVRRSPSEQPLNQYILRATTLLYRSRGNCPTTFSAAMIKKETQDRSEYRFEILTGTVRWAQSFRWTNVTKNEFDTF